MFLGSFFQPLITGSECWFCITQVVGLECLPGNLIDMSQALQATGHYTFLLLRQQHRSPITFVEAFYGPAVAAPGGQWHAVFSGDSGIGSHQANPVLRHGIDSLHRLQPGSSSLLSLATGLVPASPDSLGGIAGFRWLRQVNGLPADLDLSMLPQQGSLDSRGEEADVKLK